MKRKCDHCDRPATVHIIEIQDGQKVEKHLCELHAIEEGVSAAGASPQIGDLLQKFVQKSEPAESETPREAICDHCGLTFNEFRRLGVLGCPECYRAFDRQLVPLLRRAHEGAGEHVGKVPRCAGTDELRQQRLAALRKSLDEAVRREEYERAAQLRDELQRVEADRS